jgi:tetratricopeptide (TPR) repeat protein
LGLGKYEEAIGFYDKAPAIDPSNAVALDNKQLSTDNLR